MVTDLVFIPGWSFRATIWQRQRDYFSNLGFKVKLCDLDGLENLLAKIKLTDTIFVAWSLGWYKLLSLLKVSLHMPKAIIGISCASRFRPSLIRLLARDFNKDSVIFLERFDSWLFSPYDTARKNFSDLKGFISSNRIVDSAYLLEGLSFLRAACYFDGLAESKTNFFLLNGREDLICPVDGVLSLKKYLPAVEFTIFENTGHIPFLTCENDFNRVLLSYIKKSINDR